MSKAILNEAMLKVYGEKNDDNTYDIKIISGSVKIPVLIEFKILDEYFYNGEGWFTLNSNEFGEIDSPSIFWKRI